MSFPWKYINFRNLLFLIVQQDKRLKFPISEYNRKFWKKISFLVINAIYFFNSQEYHPCSGQATKKVVFDGW